MSRGHGEMELYVLAALTHRNEMTAAALAAGHPSVGHHLPSRALRSSLNRALRNLRKQGQIIRFERDGLVGFSICETPGERLRTAYHEAGHAIVGRLAGLNVVSATIKPKSNTAGHVMFEKHAENPVVDGVVDLAGKYAEELLLNGDPRHPWQVPVGHRKRGASSDHKNVRDRIIRHVGRPLGDGRYLVRKSDARAFRRKLESEAKTLVLEYRDAISRVAEALIVHETLTSAEIDALLLN
jgi:hypothetical protein